MRQADVIDSTAMPGASPGETGNFTGSFPSRRSVLTGLLTAPAVLAVPALAAIDPAVAAYQRYRHVLDTYNAAPIVDDDAYDDPLLIALDEAEVDLFDSVPTSAAGVADLLRYTFERGSATKWASRLVTGTATASDRRELCEASQDEKTIWRAIQHLDRLGGRA